MVTTLKWHQGHINVLLYVRLIINTMRKCCRKKYTVLLLGVVGILFVFFQGWRLIGVHKHLNVVQIGKKEQVERVRHGVKPDGLRLMKELLNANNLDSSKEYVYAPNILTPLSSSIKANGSHVLTLCSHTTANHVHYLKDLMAAWTGPVSVTVFTHGKELMQLLEALLYYQHCFVYISKFVSFHIAYPVSLPPMYMEPSDDWNFECGSEPQHLKQNDSSNYKSNVPYPHNVLRNIAITFAKTPYILSLDIDLVPSLNLQAQFELFAKQRKNLLTDMTSKVAFVLPAFETSLPAYVLNKDKLMEHLSKNLVRPFYQSVCQKCQYNTDYDQWKMLPSIGFLDIGYYAVFERPWEPFYIARKQDLPLYDARFKQYGMNRFSQICEMHMSGYSFAVLNNAFVIHRGFKELRSFHDTKTKEHRKNMLMFKVFEAELKMRYPDSGRHC